MKGTRHSLFRLAILGLLGLIIIHAPVIAATALVNSGVLAITHGHDLARINAFEDALHIEPNNIRANTYVGEQKIKIGKPEVGIPYLRITLEGDPDDIFTGIELGFAYQAIGEMDKAITVWRQVHAKDYFLSLGRRLQSQGNFKGAQADFRTALAISPQSVDAKLGIAQSMQSLGDNEEALQLLLELVPDTPDDIQGYQAIFTSYFAMNDYSSAAQWDDRTAKIVSADLAPLYYGRAALFRGDYILAIEELKKATQFNPNDDYLYYLLCLSYRGQGDKQSAVIACQKRIDLKSPPPASYFVDLGNVLLEAGEKTKAQSAFEQALKIAPENQPAIEGLRKISR